MSKCLDQEPHKNDEPSARRLNHRQCSLFVDTVVSVSSEITCISRVLCLKLSYFFLLESSRDNCPSHQLKDSLLLERSI